MNDVDIDKFDLYISEKLNKGTREMLESVKEANKKSKLKEKGMNVKRLNTDKENKTEAEEYDER